MRSNVEKNIYKLRTKTGLLFLCSNINTDSPLSSNCVKLEKLQVRNLRFLQRSLLRWLTCYETVWKTSMLEVGVNICST